VPSADGKKLFVATAQLRGELMSYDSASHQFTPYLSGISAMGVNFSRDEKLRAPILRAPSGEARWMAASGSN
jgi:hypothetical protein